MAVKCSEILKIFLTVNHQFTTQVTKNTKCIVLQYFICLLEGCCCAVRNIDTELKGTSLSCSQ